MALKTMVELKATRSTSKEMTTVFHAMAIWYIYRDTEQPQQKEAS